MNFTPHPEQQEFQDAVSRFAEKELRPGAHQRAHTDAYPWDVAKKMAAQGLLGITIAEADGGQGGTLMDAIIAIQAVAPHCPRSADVIQAGNFGAIRVLAEYGSAAQKSQVAGPCWPEGSALISVGMSEPEAGSAVTELKTSATPDGAGFRHQRQQGLHHPRPPCGRDPGLRALRPGRGRHRLGADRHQGRRAYAVGQRSKLHVGRGVGADLFRRCVCGARGRAAGRGRLQEADCRLQRERMGNTARSLALGRYAYQEARQWAMQRKQFGRLLCEFQGLQWKFAEMKMKLDAGQLLLYRAAANADSGIPSAEETAIAKAFCNQAGFDIANEAHPGDGRHGLQPGSAGGVLPAPLPAAG